MLFAKLDLVQDTSKSVLQREFAQNHHDHTVWIILVPYYAIQIDECSYYFLQLDEQRVPWYTWPLCDPLPW